MACAPPPVTSGGAENISFSPDSRRRTPLRLVPPSPARCRSPEPTSQRPPPPTLLLRRPQHRVPSPVSSAGEPEDTASAKNVLRLVDALGVPVDDELYISILKDCGYGPADIADVHKHASSSARRGVTRAVGNRIILSLASLGELAAAREVFDKMPEKDGLTWSTMVVAYSDCRSDHAALRLFADMIATVDGHEILHNCTAVAALRSSARARNLAFGEQIHALVVKTAMATGDIGAAVVQLYTSLGHHGSAIRFFATMKATVDPVPLSALTGAMTSCRRKNRSDMAIAEFTDMLRPSTLRNCYALSSALAACLSPRTGRQVHADAIKLGAVMDRFVASSIVYMYVKHRQSADAARSRWSSAPVSFASSSENVVSSQISYRFSNQLSASL